MAKSIPERIFLDPTFADFDRDGVFGCWNEKPIGKNVEYEYIRLDRVKE